MSVPEEIRKCVAFIGMKMATGEIRLVGTGFFIARPFEILDSSFTYFVTARHIIEGIANKGLDTVFLRLNRKDGDAEWSEVPLAHWKFHPTNERVDVALLQIGLPDEADHKYYSAKRFVTQEVIRREEIGPGSEVFLVGLFVHHSGKRRNIPIIRVGNIAAMPEESVATQLGSVEAYLVEARSIGGLSGSPVFANLGIVSVKANQLKFATDGNPVFFLLGLMHGHWDLGLTDVDESSADIRGTQRVNMGIAIVVPVEQIWEVIRQPAIANAEAEHEAKMMAESKRNNATRGDGTTNQTSA
jgi:hypothetical protein